MKHMKRILFVMLTLLSTLSCTKNDSPANDSSAFRYYVKYEVGPYTEYSYSTLNFYYSLTDDQNRTVKGSYSKSGFSEIYGPVGKGFEAHLEAKLDNYSTGQPVSIYVAINDEPFALKAWGTGKVSYTIE